VVQVLWPYAGTITVASDGTLPVSIEARSGLVVGA
jgi:hypothetical protein